MTKRTVLITGATSGIGMATARLLAKDGYTLILTGRRKERLNRLYHELAQKTAVLTLAFDVRDRQAVEEAIAGIPENFRPVDVLVNNAGNAHGLAPIHEGDTADWDAMMDGNVKGLLYVSRAISPEMVKRKYGHIINIGSIAGKEVYPNGAVYCASKHAVVALSEGMRQDLNPYGIKVSCINPGLVETEFSKVRFKGDEARAESVYRGYTPLKAEDLAEIISFILSRPAHVNIADMLVFPTDQASATMVNKKSEPDS